MNIGINCFNVNPNYSGGINSYTFGLLDGFSNCSTSHKFQVYVNNLNRKLFEKYQQVHHFEIIEIQAPAVKKIIRMAAFSSMSELVYKFTSDVLYKNVANLMDSKSDIIYTPTTFLFPFNFRRTTVISMHDVQQFHYPEYFSKTELLNRRIHSNLSVKLSRYFQASSEFIKLDLLENFKSLKQNQIVVINEGVNIKTFSVPMDTSSIILKYQLPNEFLFFPAQLWFHKNHITVLKALEILKRKSNLKIHLVLTGAKSSAYDQIFNFIKENGIDYVQYLGVVPFKDLVGLYQASKFLITAVLYESNSLPILEAAASGTPVIASKTPPNVEASQILNLNLFEPKDENQLADLINHLWKNDDVRNQQIRHNNEHINYFSWDSVAEKYIKFFEGIS